MESTIKGQRYRVFNAAFTSAGQLEDFLNEQDADGYRFYMEYFHWIAMERVGVIPTPVTVDAPKSDPLCKEVSDIGKPCVRSLGHPGNHQDGRLEWF